MKSKTAADVMTQKVVTATADMPLLSAMALLLRHRINCLPVIDTENNLLGIITEYDIMNLAFSGEAETTQVGEVMSRKVISFAPADNIEEIVSCCVEKRIHRLPIVDNGKLVGIISRHDVMRAMMEYYQTT
jgi:CBS domain-containing protein